MIFCLFISLAIKICEYMYMKLPSILRVKQIFRLEILMKEREGAITWKEEHAWRVVEANSIDEKSFFGV